LSRTSTPTAISRSYPSFPYLSSEPFTRLLFSHIRSISMYEAVLLISANTSFRTPHLRASSKSCFGDKVPYLKLSDVWQTFISDYGPPTMEKSAALPSPLACRSDANAGRGAGGEVFTIHDPSPTSISPFHTPLFLDNTVILSHKKC